MTAPQAPTLAPAPVIGTETEFGITVQHASTFNPIAASAAVVNAHENGTNRVPWSYEEETPGRDARGFSVVNPVDTMDSGLVNAVLHNGARLYVDHAHPEYSTPECGDPREAALHDKAGELVIQRAADHVTATLPEHQRMVIYKDNSDRKGNSYGAHENYLVPRSIPFGHLAHALTPFLVTRQIITGSGKIGSEHGHVPVPYQITQRADFFEEEIGLETTLKRPIINTRDEPHADPDKYRRLHLIVGDANLSEVQTFVKLGATALMLMAIEDCALDMEITLAHPVLAMTQVSVDRTGNDPLLLKGSSPATATEIQWRYLSALEAYAASCDVGPVYKQVLVEWRDLLEDLTRGYHAVADRLDWAAKLTILESYRERDGLDWDHPKLALLDMQYHDTNPRRGLYHKLVASGRMRRMFTDNEIAQAATVPPPTTRAWFRGECLRRFSDHVVAANWDSLVFDVGASSLVRVPMMEPRRGTYAVLGELLDSCPDVATLVDSLGGEND